MKKFLILCLTMVIFSGSAMAVEHSAQDKKYFYDRYINTVFLAMKLTLMPLRAPESKKSQYISAMKARLNRTELENATWACVSKYPRSQMFEKSVIDECCSTWFDNYRAQNADLRKILR